jgi:Skp family chaperone for outer membrane proteins
MKFKTMLLVCLISLAFVLTGYEYTHAQSAQPAMKIGIVSVEKIIRECKATAKHKEQLTADNARLAAEQDKLSSEIQAIKAGLQSGVLKVGSPEYLTQYWELARKQSEFDARKDFNPQQQALKNQLWTQELYQQIINITKEIGAQKELLLVLAADEPQFPLQRVEELGAVISTNKVLYNGGCQNITSDVMARLDEAESKVNP